MTTNTIKFFKETSLPGTLQSNSVYYIGAVGSAVNELEIYVTSNSGIGKRILNKTDIQELINSSITAANEIQIVADIAARNALNPTYTKYVYVKNATGDSTVSSGGATYMYDVATSTWVKISEAESMDVVLQWANIINKPSSSVTDIDDAVTKRHTHTNKVQLDKISEDVNGKLLYDSSLPYSGWDTVNW